MNIKLKGLLLAVASSALMAGCGGDSSGNGFGDNGSGGGQASIDPSRSTKSVFDFISKLMADSGENSTAIDVNALTLAADDTSNPEQFP